MTVQNRTGAEPMRQPQPPQSVFHYRLTAADARAWERRDPAVRKRNRVALGLALLAGISLLATVTGHLPDWLSRLHSNALALSILLLPMGAVFLAQRRDLARRSLSRVPAPVEVRLEVWARRLAETRADRPEPLVLGAESLRDVVETEGHVFLTARSGTIILPAAAFPLPEAKRRFAAYWKDFAG